MAAASAPLSHFQLVIHQAVCIRIAHPNFDLVPYQCISTRAGLDTIPEKQQPSSPVFLVSENDASRIAEASFALP
jgi:hypothetical protein